MSSISEVDHTFSLSSQTPTFNSSFSEMKT